jgi:hypothetical protein
MKRIDFREQLLYPVPLRKMTAFIIEKDRRIKETFGYEIPFNQTLNNPSFSTLRAVA